MKVAINGFGRIGRAVLKVALSKRIDIVAINDVHGVKDAAYLLEHDSIYGHYDKNVSISGKDLVVNGKKIRILQEREPSKLPWKKLKVDVVIESTGAFREKVRAAEHIKAGAKYVIVSAPVRDLDASIVLGVNEKDLNKKDKVISVASCTTNCLAPMLKIIDDNFGVERAFMTTVHAYTSSQRLVDGSHKKPARGRAAALNIVPTTTGATKAVGDVLPNLKGKITGMALRVPVAIGSVTDLVISVKKKTKVKKVNKAFKEAAEGKMKGILEYSTEPLVSSDIIGNTHSVIFDSLDTQVNGNLIKILGWYDNEWGYASRVVDVVGMLKRFIK